MSEISDYYKKMWARDRWPRYQDDNVCPMCNVVGINITTVSDNRPMYGCIQHDPVFKWYVSETGQRVPVKKEQIMMTEQGKERALKALEERRESNKKIERINNANLPAGSPMFFYCITCGEEMTVPESYTTRPKLCGECNALQQLGWLQ